MQRESVGVEQPEAPTKPRFAVASHELLFAEANERRCDVCATLLDDDDAADDKEGAGMYLWSRGGEIRREEVPLCEACSGAILSSALGFIDFDDEE